MEAVATCNSSEWRSRKPSWKQLVYVAIQSGGQERLEVESN